MINKNDKIFLAGHRGMVGSAIYQALVDEGYTSIIVVSKKELDLKNQLHVEQFFKDYTPDVVIDAAARVGGILANNEYPYQFLMDNLLIQNNLIDFSHQFNCKKFIFLGSSCIYPKFAPQPLKEEYLLTSSLEPTNEWYAIAKITGVKACEAIRRQFGKDFVSLMPTNLYGPRDNFDLLTSHVLPAMIRKFHEAKINNNRKVVLWGSGNPMREFLHVEDLAKAVLFSLEHTLSDNLYNVGTGTDLTIAELASVIQKIVGHEGEVEWDISKPDGTPRKLLDVARLNKEGWVSRIKLEDGIKDTYEWFLNNIEAIKEVKIV